MGLGGYLTWTAAAREIHKKHGVKTIPIEVHMGQSSAGHKIPLTRLKKDEMFRNNPYIDQEFSEMHGLQIRLNGDTANYVEKDEFHKATHKGDKHIIETICLSVGIESPELRCELFLDNDEKSEVKFHLENLPKYFICVEPHTNLDFTLNRGYPFEKWQMIVDEIIDQTGLAVVQIGTSPSLLKNVVDYRNKTTFRVVSGIIEAAKCLVASEGGLTHLCTTTSTTGVVILTGYQTEKMVAYPSNYYVNIARHGPCGMKAHCKDCAEDAKVHNYKEVVDKVCEVLEVV
ncbi:hypothetical protein CL614_09410 [archaeon]|nr:hypothetical protein [archaeon]|tara:strand:- start:1134 stop:1994 length:861 start_codon:yes stop_codon:yes gene_type:complete